jgi:hypothetical protein
LPYKCRGAFVALANGYNAPQRCCRGGGRRVTTTAAPWAVIRVGWQLLPEIPLPLVWEREEEDRGKASTARSNPTVRLCYLHKFCPQLQMRNGPLFAKDDGRLVAFDPFGNQFDFHSCRYALVAKT